MNSSVKSLVPSVIEPPDAALELALDVLLELPPPEADDDVAELELELEPQAARSTAAIRATRATITREPLPPGPCGLRVVTSDIHIPPRLSTAPPGFPAGLYDCIRPGPAALTTEWVRRDAHLHQGENPVDGESEHRDRQRTGDHARCPVRRLVDDDVPETAAPGKGGQCGRGHDVHSSRTHTGEDEWKGEGQFDAPEHRER